MNRVVGPLTMLKLGRLDARSPRLVADLPPCVPHVQRVPRNPNDQNDPVSAVSHDQTHQTLTGQANTESDHAHSHAASQPRPDAPPIDLTLHHHASVQLQ
jgi:hypothetical protein